MAGQIAIGGFVALGAFMGMGIRHPKHVSPAYGLGLVALSSLVVIATGIAGVQYFA